MYGLEEDILAEVVELAHHGNQVVVRKIPVFALVP